MGLELLICQDEKPNLRAILSAEVTILGRKMLLALKHGMKASLRRQDKGNVRHAVRATWHPRFINILNVEGMCSRADSLLTEEESR